jgi:6-methylsalicylate decarboxylase
MAPIIDIHAHYFPPAMGELYERLGGKPVWPPHPVGLAQRVEGLAAVGVDRQILCVGHNQPTMETIEGTREAARFVNDLYAEVIAAEGDGRLAAFGSLPLPDIDASLAEIARIYDELGFVGINLGTSVFEQPIDAFEPIWEELDRRAATVFIHPVGTRHVEIVGLRDFLLGPTLGGPNEAAVAAARLINTGVTTRHPNVKYVLAAGGGSFPYLWPRFAEVTEVVMNDEQRGEIAYEGDIHAAPRTFFYDTCLGDHPEQTRFLVDMVGAERVVFGSDEPRVTAEHWLTRIRANLDYAKADHETVLGGTARAELGL